MYEPLLLYSGFAPFTDSLVEASAYFRGGQCDKDWLEDERERLFDALDAEMPPLPDPSPPPPLDLLAVHPLANYGSRAGDLQATDYDPWEPEQSELPTQTSSPPPPPPPAPAPAHQPQRSTRSHLVRPLTTLSSLRSHSMLPPMALASWRGSIQRHMSRTTMLRTTSSGRQRVGLSCSTRPSPTQAG